MITNIFFYFIQTTINKNKKIYDEKNIYSFWEKIFSAETGDPNHFLVKLIFYVYWQNKTHKSLLELYKCKNSSSDTQISDQNNIKKIVYSKNIFLKFKFLRETLNNPFLSENIKNECLNVFCRAQTLYHRFNRFAYLYKYKKDTYQIKEDIFMNPISETHKNTIIIYQNRKKYLFVIADLLNIINTSLTYCDPLPSPKSIKNPYNNIPFKKSILYTIYFFIKRRDFKIPLLFHFFFLSDFNFIIFSQKYERAIIEEYLRLYVKNSFTDVIYFDVMKMIKNFNQDKTNKICIHADFPKDILVEKFKPFLYYYLLFCYHSINVNQSGYYYKIWNERMELLQQKNPLFGRKNIHIQNKNMFLFNNQKRHISISFHDECISFYTLE
jgi:hypothetical protein